jgi:hypothetical protein
MAFVKGEDVTAQLDLPALFRTLPLTMEHEYTQLLTAASAAAVVDAITAKKPTILHAPGPCGLPGGYPIRACDDGVEVVLPPGVTLDAAINLNREAQKLNGSERIDQDGTVYFVEQHMAILKDLLGYECRSMTLEESEERAQELLAKYGAFAQRHT